VARISVVLATLISWCAYIIVQRAASESGALTDLVAGDGVQYGLGVADLRHRRVALADQVAADRIGDDLGGVQRAEIPDRYSDVVIHDHVAGNGVTEGTEPGALPSLDNQVAADGVLLDREVDVGIERRPRTPPVETTLPRMLTAVRYIVSGWSAMMLPPTVSFVVTKPQGGCGIGGPSAPGEQPSASVAPLRTETLRPTVTVPNENASRHAPGASVRFPATVRDAPSATKALPVIVRLP
jgi:hypothetical protein